MKEKFAKLINVKSIVTVLLTLMFCLQVGRGGITEANFMEIFKLIIIFYFGTQIGRQEGKK